MTSFGEAATFLTILSLTGAAVIFVFRQGKYLAFLESRVQNLEEELQEHQDLKIHPQGAERVEEMARQIGLKISADEVVRLIAVHSHATPQFTALNAAVEQLRRKLDRLYINLGQDPGTYSKDFFAK